VSEKLRQAELVAAEAVGDVIEHWGFRKALGRAWTILYLEPEPLGAAELAERLSMSAGAVSTTLQELQRWGVARRVWKPGERREFFEAETDFWKMISKVVSERERFLADSVRTRIEQAISLAEAAKGAPRARHMVDSLKRLLALTSTAQGVLDSFIVSQRADFQRFADLLRFGRAARAAGRSS
jgi:DNA-binding transcriptional regulator GbsR (MarR family)